MANITVPSNGDTLLSAAAAAAESGARTSVQALQTVICCGDFTALTLQVQCLDSSWVDVDADGVKLLEFTAPGCDNITLAAGVNFKLVVTGGTSTSAVLYTGAQVRG